jgi:hypothetical protein
MSRQEYRTGPSAGIGQGGRGVGHGMGHYFVTYVFFFREVFLQLDLYFVILFLKIMFID